MGHLSKIPSVLEDGDMDEKESAFWDFHSKNPHVYCEFERHAIAAFFSGRNHYTGSRIWEDMRLSPVQTTSTDFKLPNTILRCYVLCTVRSNPFLQGFFKINKKGSPRKGRPTHAQYANAVRCTHPDTRDLVSEEERDEAFRIIKEFLR